MEQNQDQAVQAQGYESMYPEMYYKVQPFILAASDEIDQCGCGMPTRDAVRMMSDRVYGDVCRMYPEMRIYGQSTAAQSAGEVQASRVGGGLLRDILDIWLLNEIFNRRRRW